MIILVYENNKITEIYGTDSLEKASLFLDGKEYKIYQDTNAHIGLHIESVNADGTLKGVSEQIDLGIIELKEDEVLDGEIIRKLTETELKEKYPERYPNEEVQEESPEKTVQQTVREKEREITSLKDQYLDADLEDNDSLKLELKKQIQIAKQELVVLESELTDNDK